MSQSAEINTHTHTHTHTEREREREREIERERNYIDIRRELHTTYCQMHYISYCTANIYQI